MNTQTQHSKWIVLILMAASMTACSDSDLQELQSKQLAKVQSDSTSEPTPSAGLGVGRETAAEIIANSTLIFSDEFNAATIDSTKWNTRYNWGPDTFIAQEEQYYVDRQNSPDFGFDPFVLNGEILSITADRTPADKLNDTGDQPYISGTLTTSGKFDFTYGYAETRARMPIGKGLSAVFWMLGAQFVDLKPTLVVAETDADKPSSVYHRYNYTDSENAIIDSGQLESSGTDFSEDFHTFGVSWTENSLTYYIDGSRRHAIAHDNISKQPMYLILNLAVGGVLPGSPDENTVFPGDYAVDYVRVYQVKP